MSSAHDPEAMMNEEPIAIRPKRRKRHRGTISKREPPITGVISDLSARWVCTSWKFWALVPYGPWRRDEEFVRNRDGIVLGMVFGSFIVSHWDLEYGTDLGNDVLVAADRKSHLWKVIRYVRRTRAAERQERSAAANPT